MSQSQFPKSFCVYLLVGSYYNIFLSDSLLKRSKIALKTKTDEHVKSNSAWIRWEFAFVIAGRYWKYRQLLLYYCMISGSRRPLNPRDQQNFRRQLLSRRKVAQMLIAVVIMFGVCYLPVHLLNILRYNVYVKSYFLLLLDNKACTSAYGKFICICVIKYTHIWTKHFKINNYLYAKFASFADMLRCLWETGWTSYLPW
jgi:hypothetical protein